MTADRAIVIAGAVVAVLLQVVLAPYISIGFAVPDFIAVFALLVAVTRPHSFGAVLPFVLGLACDLLTGGPLGVMAFSLTAFSFLTARLLSVLDNDTLFMPLALLALGLLLVELSYGMFLLLFGYNAGIAGVLAYRIVPCFAYDLVLAVVLYPLAARFFKQSGPVNSNITLLR